MGTVTTAVFVNRRNTAITAVTMRMGMSWTSLVEDAVSLPLRAQDDFVLLAANL
jgi:hypothetical protein